MCILRFLLQVKQHVPDGGTDGDEWLGRWVRGLAGRCTKTSSDHRGTQSSRGGSHRKVSTLQMQRSRKQQQQQRQCQETTNLTQKIKINTEPRKHRKPKEESRLTSQPTKLRVNKQLLHKRKSKSTSQSQWLMKRMKKKMRKRRNHPSWYQLL